MTTWYVGWCCTLPWRNWATNAWWPRTATRWVLFGQCCPEVVITDRLMPGLDGLELCRRIRALPPGGYTYIVRATSLDEREEILDGMEAGADDYLIKPLDPVDLEAALVAAQRVTSLHAELDRYRNELARLACTDPLTQLRNRLSLGEDLQTLHVRSQRYGRTYCLAMCDVDFFKAYNDAAGHQAGDEVLRAVGATLGAHARGGDSVYRYGGEEFLLILPEQTLESAGIAAERLRRGVEELAITYPVGTAGAIVTISVGIAAFDPANEMTADDVLKEADLALYRAKESGRNRVVVADGHLRG